MDISMITSKLKNERVLEGNVGKKKSLRMRTKTFGKKKKTHNRKDRKHGE